MEESEQQAFLRQAKESLGLTWDDLARASGIAPRALKTYRMPVTSQDYRALPGLARAAIERLMSDRKIGHKRRA
jgi:transcriptional regulator with XRE-family HTH domain